MRNPWTEITVAKRTLECDKEAIHHYNLRRPDNPINSKDFPEPFLGNSQATVYLLFGNPGFDPETPTFEYSPPQEQSALTNLSFSSQRGEYPLYLLNPLFTDHPGYGWWHQIFQPLAKELNVNMKVLSQKFFCIELYGYHTKDGDDHLANELPSVEFSKKLVRQAMKESKLILICRAVNKWLTLIPELRDYDLCSFVASNRKIRLSRTTISPPVYNQIKEHLHSK